MIDLAIGLGFVFVAAVIYLFSNPDRLNWYNEFVWLADAFLHGQATIAFPVDAPGPAGNAYFQDVMPLVSASGEATGRAIIPFPPLPAIALLPFVVAFGFATDAQGLAALFAAAGVGLAFWMLGGLPIRRGSRIGAVAFFAFGSVFWYAAASGTTWFIAHVIATDLALIAVAIVVRARASRDDLDLVQPGRSDAQHVHRATAMYLFEHAHDVMGEVRDRVRQSIRACSRRDLAIPTPSLVLAALLLGLAATARMPIIVGAVFILVAGGGLIARRPISIIVGVAVPLLLLAAYNIWSSGYLFNPAYQYLYESEASAYPDLRYNIEWAIEDIRYIPQNLAIMFAWVPELFPACPDDAVRGFTTPECLYVVPDQVGTSILLMSPPYLLVLIAAKRHWRSSLIWGGLAASVAIATLDLMHFSQGWVQIGYRFSNDFVAFALPLVAIGLDRLRGPWRAVGWALVCWSIAANAWAVVTRMVLEW